MSQERSMQDWREGDPFSASHLQEAVAMLRPLSSMGGGGATEVTQLPNGTSVYTPEALPLRQGVHFAVKVEKTGGADGTASTVATWTYTMRRIDWTNSGGQVSADYEYGTAKVQTRPRPKGKMTFQTGDQGYGVAFYNASGGIMLWDAGEVPTTGTC